MEKDPSGPGGPFWDQLSSVSAYIYSGPVATPKPPPTFDTQQTSGSPQSFTIGSDQVYISGVGVVSREHVMPSLALGHHVLDHKGNKITVEDLEREIDPNGSMHPSMRRGGLWKKVRKENWQSYDHEKGLVPSQPVIDERSQSDWYGKDEALRNKQRLEPRERWIASMRKNHPSEVAEPIIALLRAQQAGAPSSVPDSEVNSPPNERHPITSTSSPARTTATTVTTATSSIPSLLLATPSSLAPAITPSFASSPIRDEPAGDTEAVMARKGPNRTTKSAPKTSQPAPATATPETSPRILPRTAPMAELPPMAPPESPPPPKPLVRLPSKVIPMAAPRPVPKIGPSPLMPLPPGEAWMHLSPCRIRNEPPISSLMEPEDDGYQSDSSIVSCTRSEMYLMDLWGGVNYFVADEPANEAIPEYTNDPDMSQLRSLISSQPKKRSILNDSGIALTFSEPPPFPPPAERLKPRRFAGRRYTAAL